MIESPGARDAGKIIYFKGKAELLVNGNSVRHLSEYILKTQLVSSHQFFCKFFYL